MVCSKSEHRTVGRSFFHAPDPQLQELGSQEVEVDAPCILAPNNCDRMRDSQNNIVGRTVAMKGNGHGMCTFCLTRNTRRFPVDRSANEYVPTLGLALKHSEHMRELRYASGLDDVDNAIGIMEEHVKKLHGPDVTSEDLVQRMMGQSTFLPYDLSYQHCECLSSRNIAEGEVSEDQPGALVTPENAEDRDDLGKFCKLL